MVAHTLYSIDSRVRQEAEALVQSGFSVDVICINEPGAAREEELNRVKIHRLPITKKRGGSLRYLYEWVMLTIMATWKLTTMHLRLRFHVIHAHNMPDFLLLTGLIPRLCGAKLILDVHDPTTELYKSMSRISKNTLFFKTVQWQEKFCLNIAEKVISVNETMRENIENKRVPKNKICILHNFPDGSLFPVQKKIETWPRNSDKIVLLYTGTVTDHYNLDIAVVAISLVAKVIPNIILRIVGPGNKVEEIMALALDLGIRDKIKYTDWVPIEKVKNEMNNADIGISCHKKGVFGDLYFSTKILEFMTQGLPVISSRTYTIEKYIPEDAIFYFEPEQIEDLVKQIILMCNNPDLVSKKIMNSKKVLAKYSWQEERKRLLSLYEELMD